MVLLRDMSEPEQKPVAWAFYNKDGSIRFIIDDQRRHVMEAWRSAHEGKIVRLVPAKEATA